jgi:hypothetical protein
MKLHSPIDNEVIDEESSGNASLLLLYDWFKHITTLSLLTLGGLLSILQAGEAQVRPGVLAAIVGLIAFAGILGFEGQNRVLQAQLASQPIPKSLGWFRRLAVVSFSIGTGIFLTLFLESVS